jgi:hypothetical protein
MKNLNLKEKLSKNFLFESDIAVFHEIDKKRILRNNLKLIFFLNLFPFVGLLFSLIYYKWVKLVLDDSSALWFHLLFVYDELTGEKYFFSEFIHQICKQHDELIKKNGCSFYGIFEVSGIISFIFLSISLVIYFIFLLQLLMSIKDKGKFLSRFCFKQKSKQIIILIMNFLGLFFWLVVCVLTEFSFERVGVSVYVLFFSSIFLCPLLCYYIYMKKSIKTENAISNLLDPDQTWKEEFKPQY